MSRSSQLPPLRHDAGMRSFAAGLALFLSFVFGAAALAAYVAHEVLLDPDRTGELVGSALQQPDLRSKILTRAVPGYVRLPAQVRAQVDAVARTAATGRAAKKVTLGSDGEVGLRPVQVELARALRDNGQPGLAAKVAASGADATVQVPSKYLDRYESARDTSQQVATRGAVLTALLLLVALLVSADRRRTVRSIGVSALSSCVVVALIYWLAPLFVRAASSSAVFEAVGTVLQAQRVPVLVTLAPVAAVGLVLVIVPVLLGSSRRRDEVSR